MLKGKLVKIGTTATEMDMKELNGAIEPIELVDLSTKIQKAMLNLLTIVVQFVTLGMSN